MISEPDFERMVDEIFYSLQNTEIAKKEAYNYLKKVYGEKFLNYLQKRPSHLQSI